jgi:hypothetical protein
LGTYSYISNVPMGDKGRGQIIWNKYKALSPLKTPKVPNIPLIRESFDSDAGAMAQNLIKSLWNRGFYILHIDEDEKLDMLADILERVKSMQDKIEYIDFKI